jgi:pectate lyase
MRLSLTFLLLAPLLQAGPLGFASLDGGTTGGGDAKPVIVRTANELQDAIERLDVRDKKLRNTEPRVIQLAGDINLGELANQKPGNDLKKVGIIQPCSHTTLEGPPGGATLTAGTIELHGVENVIIRNLRFRGLWEHDDSGEYDEMGWDYLRITSAGKTGSRHVWVDHCDFGKVYDGQLDVVHGSDLVTISHCIFSGGEGEQKKGLLFGHSSSDSAREQDKGHLNVTIHDCWFRGLTSRAPRLRTGNVHFLNNLVENTGTATISVTGGATLVEGSVYKDCKEPTSFSHADDNVKKNRGGSIRIVDSLDLGKKAGDRFANHPAEFRFNPPIGFEWTDLAKPPYSYQAKPAAQVEEAVKQNAGPK